jgi:hypothetical protein
MKVKILSCLITFLLATSATFGKPVVGRIDDFEDGTVQEWSGGAEPNNIPNGGPFGSGDHYLQIRRPTSVAPYPFHLGAKNTTAWSGDYLAAGIRAIEMDVKTFSVASGPDNLSMRIVLFGPGGAFSTKEPVTIITEDDWQHIEFGLTRSDLVRVLGYGAIYEDPGPGIDNLTETLSDVETLLIRHDPAPNPTPIGLHPEHILATVGIDNIAAVPGQAPTYHTSWIFGNMGNQSYVLNSVEPNDAVSDKISQQNPELLLYLSKRYQITVLDDANHPIEIIAKGADLAEEDDILLSASAGIEGSYERDPDIAWVDSRNGTVTFTMTERLYNVMVASNKKPGYRCAVHTETMRGDFSICTDPIAGDLNGDCIVDLSDLELFLADWMKNRIVP